MASLTETATALNLTKLLGEWHQLVHRKIQIHYFSESYYYMVSQCLNAPIAMLTALAGALTFSLFDVAEGTFPAQGLVVASGVLQLVVTVALAMRAIIDIPGRLAMHKSAHAKLVTILNAIEGNERLTETSGASLLKFISVTYEDTTVADYSIPWRYLLYYGYALPQDRLLTRPLAPIAPVMEVPTSTTVPAGPDVPPVQPLLSDENRAARTEAIADAVIKTNERVNL